MKQCGDEWKAAKAAGTTNGQTWQEFLKTCKAQKAGAPRGPRRRACCGPRSGARCAAPAAAPPPPPPRRR